MATASTASTANHANLRALRCWELQESITITDFAKWQSCLEFNLVSFGIYEAFLKSDASWSKVSVTNRGLTGDPETVAENSRKTALQKNALLTQMLGIIAQYSPSLLRNDIIKKSTSMSWIWNRIRRHYGFQQSEVHFLNIHNIRRKEGERYETLYQRLVSHIDDNLLTAGCNITYDGEPVTEDEELSPTCERLTVYLWLTLIDPRLPAYVGRVYAHDLQSKCLKDIQPQICLAMDSLLAELETQEGISVSYSKSSWSKDRKPRNRPPTTPSSSSSSKSKHCILCKSAGRNYTTHDINSCYHISKFDRMEMSRALKVVTFSDDEADSDQREDNDVAICTTTPQDQEESSVCRVSSSPSPTIYTFYRHIVCKILIDSGATSSMVSLAFVQRANLKVYPATQSARQLDKSRIGVKGECKFVVTFGKLELKVEALITDTMDCDVLAGIPFGMDNDVTVHMRSQEVSIMGVTVPYGAQSPPPTHDIRRLEAVILRNDTSRVVYPGEFVEIQSTSLSNYEGEVSIEPRVDSPLQGSWPSPTISRVIQGTVRIPNDTDEPIHLSKTKHFAQIRRVSTPTTVPAEHNTQDCLTNNTQHDIAGVSYSLPIVLDDQLNTTQKEAFRKLHLTYDQVFNPSYGVYNGASGPYKAGIQLGTVEPPSSKPMLPLYPRSNMQSLQQESDKLEVAGVLAKPEDINVKVKFVSPSFLRKKPDGTNRFITAFNELGSYTKVLPTTGPTSNDVLRRLSAFRFIIKTDLTKAFFQIPLDKESMAYLGTITPFKGIRVYTRCVMGCPGSSEHLRELMTRVVGDFLAEGFLIIKDDDMYVGADTIHELICCWEKVLQRMSQNNLSLNAPKTVIAPRKTTVLGWIWECGTISAPPHKVSPLICADPPKTTSAMRSYIGAYKALSRCIPGYSSVMAPLENCIKGKDGKDNISWDPNLVAHFHNAQKALQTPSVLTIPTPSDKLTMTVDASPLNDGICATLFVARNGKLLVADNFSLKLKSHHTSWEPCELEALAITAGIKHFSPYLRESPHQLIVYTDSKPCVQAHNKLLKGHFSASARISSFLSCLSEYNVTLTHIKGSDNVISDYGSRNPQPCEDSSCQICKFVKEIIDEVVRAVEVSDVIKGNARMPFLNKQAWLSAQQECHELRRAVAHLRAATRPSRKTRGMRNVKRYLKIASISTSGLLVVRKPDLYQHMRELIVVPKDILPGILHALHLYFSHCTETQLIQLFNRHFYCVGSEPIIKLVTENCHQCASMKKVPAELFEQTSITRPTTIGQHFSADVIKRKGQAIFSLRDIHSAYTTATIVPDETGPSLRSALFSCSSYLIPSCNIRVDNARD